MPPIVLQRDVELGHVFLDQSGLEKEGLTLVVGDNGFKILSTTHQLPCLPV